MQAHQNHRVFIPQPGDGCRSRNKLRVTIFRDNIRHHQHIINVVSGESTYYRMNINISHGNLFLLTDYKHEHKY